jgi:hypothetical protein
MTRPQRARAILVRKFPSRRRFAQAPGRCRSDCPGPWNPASPLVAVCPLADDALTAGMPPAYATSPTAALFSPGRLRQASGLLLDRDHLSTMPAAVGPECRQCGETRIRPDERHRPGALRARQLVLWFVGTHGSTFSRPPRLVHSGDPPLTLLQHSVVEIDAVGPLLLRARLSRGRRPSRSFRSRRPHGNPYIGMSGSQAAAAAAASSVLATGSRRTEGTYGRPWFASAPWSGNGHALGRVPRLIAPCLPNGCAALPAGRRLRSVPSW